MLTDVRVAAGPGFPPSIFTTNASESLNAALKKKMNFKETEWPEFNEAMKKFVMAQRDDIIRATYGRGQYRVTQEYARLLVSHQEWIKMTPEQRKDVLKRFDSAKVKRDTFASPLLPSGSFAYSTTGPEAVITTCAEGEGSTLAHHRHFSAAVKDCGISTLPLATLDAI